MLDPSTIGPAIDLYALGAVAYFLLTARRVFDGKTAIDLCLQHVTKPPIPPSQAANTHVPRALEELVLACLEKQPAQRPASAAVLGEQLRAIGPFDDWDDARAHQWWREFRPHDRSADVGVSPTTMTVDIGGRDEVLA